MTGPHPGLTRTCYRRPDDASFGAKIRALSVVDSSRVFAVGEAPKERDRTESDKLLRVRAIRQFENSENSTT